MAARAGVAGVQMAHHEESQIARQLLAAVPHGTYVECFADPERDPVWQTMWANRPAIKDGTLEVGSEPGFGLVLDEAVVRRYRVSCGFTPLGPGSVPRGPQQRASSSNASVKRR